MSPRISTYVLTMDSSLPCISLIASFRQNNLIAWKGRPRCLHLKTKRSLNSLLLLLYLCLSSLRLWKGTPDFEGLSVIWSTRKLEKRRYAKAVTIIQSSWLTFEHKFLSLCVFAFRPSVFSFKQDETRFAKAMCATRIWSNSPILFNNIKHYTTCWLATARF